MKVKYIYIFVFFLIFPDRLIFSAATIFNKNFQNEYQLAIKTYESRQSEIQFFANEYGIDPDIISAVIFPEIMRYSYLKDKAEISALYSLYILFGSEFSNYSVGMFQMKPSFIERLEEEIKQYPDLERLFLINEFPENISENNLKSIRVKRMINEEWQVKYLISFIKIMERNFSSYLSKIEDQKEIVRFYSTAYNTGIFKDKKKINRFINKKFYNTNHGLYNYSDISLYFYQNYIKK